MNIGPVLVLNETSSLGPALTTFGVPGIPPTSTTSGKLGDSNSRLCLAWKGDGNNSLNLLFSNDMNVSQTGQPVFGNKIVSGETSQQAPSVASDGVSTILIAWMGVGNDEINIAQVTSDLTGLTGKVTLTETTLLSPAISFAGENFILAWKGDGNNVLNFRVSTDGGHSFGAKYESSETSTQAPKLYGDTVVWTGVDNNELNWATLAISNGVVTGLANKVTSTQTSSASPAIVTNSSPLGLVAWKGNGNNALNGMEFGQITSNGEISPSQTSAFAPALTATNGAFWIAWTGLGNNELNVATIGSQIPPPIPK